VTAQRGLVTLGVIVLGVLATVIANGQQWMFNRDFFTYWGGGRGLLEGANLYDSATWQNITRVYGSTWFPNPIFIYAPPTAILFAPLAALPVPVAAVLWVWLSEIFVVLTACVIAWSLRWRRPSSYALFWAIGIMFFVPVLLTFLMGQVSALILILVASSAALWDRGKWSGGGLLLGIAIVKPQPIALLIPMLALWLWLNRRWRALGGVAISFGVSILASFVLFPSFVSDWQSAASAKVSGVADRMPTLWGLTLDLLGASPLAWASAWALVLLATVVCVVIVVRWRNKSATELISVLLVFSLLVTPYLWNYDQILLLIPFLVALIRMDLRGASFRQAALLPLVFDILAMAFFVIASVRLRDGLSAMLSLFVGGMLWFALLNQPAPSGEPV